MRAELISLNGKTLPLTQLLSSVWSAPSRPKQRLPNVFGQRLRTQGDGNYSIAVSSECTEEAVLDVFLDSHSMLPMQWRRL